MVNLQEVLDPLDVFRKLTGLRLEDVYNLMLKKGWTLGSPQLTRGMHVVLRLYLPAQVRLLREFWKQDRPDLVVSLVPNFNRALHGGPGRPVTPLVTILTDIADYPPHFWIERQRAVPDLRLRARRGAGALAGPPRCAHLPRLRHDPEPALLRARRRNPEHAQRACAGPAHGPGAVRRRGLGGHAGDRAAARGFARAAHHDLRPQREAGRAAARHEVPHPHARSGLHARSALVTCARRTSSSASPAPAASARRSP